MKKILVVIKEFNRNGGISQFVLEYYNELSTRQNMKIG